MRGAQTRIAESLWKTGGSVSENESQDTDQEKLDPRLRRFLARAVPVIAEERGVNERSLIKIRTIAAELHLPVDLYQQGLRRLKRIGTGQSLSRYEREFVRYLKRELRQLPSSILTVTLENRIVDVASRRYRLAPDRAREIITQRAMKYGIGRISRSEAERHVELMIADRIQQATFIDDQTRERLIAFGREWGVDQPRIESIAEQILTQNRERRSRGRGSRLPMWIMLAISMACVVAIPIIVIRSRPQDPQEAEQSGSPAESAATRQFASWWPAPLQLKIAQTANRFLPFDTLRPSLASDDQDERQQAIVACVDLLYEPTLGPAEAESLEQTVFEIIAREPDSENKLAAIRRMRELVGLAGLPQTPRDIQRAFYSLELLERLYRFLQPGSGIRELCAAEIESATGQAIQGEPDFGDRVQRQMAVRFLTQAREQCWTRPQQVIALLPKLLATCRRHLPETEFRSARDEILFNLIHAVPDQWEDYNERIAVSIAESERGELVPWIDLIATIERSPLQQHIQFLVSDKLRAEVEPGDPVDVANQLRAAATGIRPASRQFSSRRDAWIELVAELDSQTRRNFPGLGLTLDAEPILAQPPSGSGVDSAAAQTLALTNSDWERLADAVAANARLNSLALALATGRDQGSYAGFDDRVRDDLLGPLVADPVADRTLGLEQFGMTFRSPQAGDQGRLAGWIEQLADSETPPAAKSAVLQQLGAVAERFSDVDRRQARKLTDYFLSPLAAVDKLVVWQTLPKLRRWRSLHDQLLNRIRDNDLPEDLLPLDGCQLVAVWVDVPLDQLMEGLDVAQAGPVSPAVQQRLLEQLLRAAIGRLETTGTPARTQGKWMACVEVLRSEYLRRLEVLRKSRALAIEPVGDQELADLAVLYALAVGEDPRSQDSMQSAAADTSSQLRHISQTPMQQLALASRMELDTLAARLAADEAEKWMGYFEPRLAGLQSLGQQLLVLEQAKLIIWKQILASGR